MVAPRSTGRQQPTPPCREQTRMEKRERENTKSSVDNASFGEGDNGEKEEQHKAEATADPLLAPTESTDAKKKECPKYRKDVTDSSSAQAPTPRGGVIGETRYRAYRAQQKKEKERDEQGWSVIHRVSPRKTGTVVAPASAPATVKVV